MTPSVSRKSYVGGPRVWEDIREGYNTVSMDTLSILYLFDYRTVTAPSGIPYDTEDGMREKT